MDNISLTALAREQLEIARRTSSGRSARTVHGGHEHRLRQTVIALAAGRSLDEHGSPEEATVHVLQGRVCLIAGEVSWPGGAGHLIAVPDARHTLTADEDSVILLTALISR
jgi:quercetin dioxygenase-like cupin family protein